MHIVFIENYLLRSILYHMTESNITNQFIYIQVKISADASTIIGSECECKAGNGHCSHSLGLLYLVSHYQKLGLAAVPPVQSRTSLPQTWHIPSRVEGLAPKSVDSLKISKIKPQQGTPPKKKKRVTEGILPNIYCPVEKPISSDFSQQLMLNLKSVGSDAQILKILPSTSTSTVESTFGPVPFGCPLSYQQKLNSTITDILNHPDVVYPNFPYPNLQQSYNTVLPENQLNMLLGMHITETTSKEVEEQTRLQSQNKTWHDVRKNRITSSVFKDVCSRRADFAALASRFLKSKNIMTAQMKFGIENEPVAAKTYSEITGNSVYLCGFVINPSAPYLGTSPDRKVFDPNATPEYGLLEIKCPSKDSFTECKYLVQNKNNHSFKLRTSHGYYFQIIGQMALTGLKWCDFFVKCRNDFHMERISFDQDKWDSMKSSLDKFYFEEMLPQICHKD
ncbi:uncharacterized protein LOC134247605 [Saccostrea cucullata]|uniref:uncharacterized protein LOC134247605 n=1 Tax=Saccostrea cuccullata TaxID=36930 RepID=UPI002ED5D773